MAENRRKFEDDGSGVKDVQVSVNKPKSDSGVLLSNEMEYDMAINYIKTPQTSNPSFTARFLGDSNTTTLDLNALDRLTNNPQGDVAKVIEISSHARKMANASDLHGKIYEAIENNTNPSYKLVFPQNMEGEKKRKQYDKKVADVKLLLDEKLFGMNDLDSLIASEVVPLAYLEGNKVLNMRNTGDGYIIESYPIGIAEISDYKRLGENLIMINMDSLKKGLDSLGIKDKKKRKENDVSDYEEELKKHYPEEVNEAYKQREKYATLNFMTSGVIRNKNMGGKYGVSSFLPSFKSHIQLETIDATDNINARARAKKFVVQTLRKEMAGNNGKDKHFVELNYANENLFAAASRETVIVTTPAYVEKVELLEFKNALTPIANINYYRYQTMNALGIGFLSAETNSKFTATQVSFKEIIRTINKLNRQLSAYLNKCIYYIVQEENAKLLDVCPKIVIEDAEWLDNELRLKLSTFLFTMLGSSYETAYGLLGVDADEEKRIRQEENELGYNDVFSPRASIYTTSGNGSDVNTKTDKKEENQNPDKDVQADDKARTQNEK